MTILVPVYRYQIWLGAADKGTGMVQFAIQR